MTLVVIAFTIAQYIHMNTLGLTMCVRSNENMFIMVFQFTCGKETVFLDVHQFVFVSCNGVLCSVVE